MRTYLNLGSATEDVDYISGPYHVTFPVGSTNISFNVTIIVDNVLENNEVFVLRINSITNNNMLGSPVSTTVIIEDTTGKINYSHTYGTARFKLDAHEHSTRV